MDCGMEALWRVKKSTIAELVRIFDGDDVGRESSSAAFMIICSEVIE
jgi:hypothetical protein